MGGEFVGFQQRGRGQWLIGIAERQAGREQELGCSE